MFSHAKLMKNDSHLTMIYTTLNGNSNILSGSKSKVRGNLNKCSLSKSDIHGNKNAVQGDDNVIVGDRNTIRGNENKVRGDYNHVFGDCADVSGDYNIIYGDDCIVTGRHNDIRGKKCILNGRRMDKIARIEDTPFSAPPVSAITHDTEHDPSKDGESSVPCVICQVNKVRCIILPCGDANMCITCSRIMSFGQNHEHDPVKVDNLKCPTCRGPVKEIKRIFM